MFLLPVSLQGLDLLVQEHVVEFLGRKRDMEAAAVRTQPGIELLPLSLIAQKLLELLHVLLVSDRLE